MHHVRADTRTQLARQGAQQGGDGVVLASGTCGSGRSPASRAAATPSRRTTSRSRRWSARRSPGFADAPAKPSTLSVVPLNNSGDRLRPARPGEPHADVHPPRTRTVIGESDTMSTLRSDRPGRPRRRDAAPGRAAARQARLDLHQRPLGQRVPAGPGGWDQADRAGAGQLDLPRRDRAGPLGQEPGARNAQPGHVPRTRVGDDPDGGRGGPAGRGRHRRRPTDRRGTEFGSDIAEFIAIGTAVKADHPAPGGTSWRNNKGQPFTSDLSGQDFWT